MADLRQVKLRLAPKTALALLVITVAGLALGGGLHLAGRAASGDAVWLVACACGLAYVSWTVVDSMRRRRVGVDVIALLALAGAVAVGELLAGAVISVMLASGRALEGWAAGRARRDLTALLERSPRTARRYCDGSIEQVPLEDIIPGDKLLVTHGDLVPVDGLIAAGQAALDESALTGEPIPIHRQPGDQVRSGAVNAGAPFDLVATVKADESTYAGIVRMVSEAEQAQPPFVRLADRYAIWFLLVSLVTAALAWALAGAERAVAVLVVATPCPLILAVPIALVSGMSIAARRGAVVKGGGVLERLARCTTLLLDKTGTLTSGHPAVASIVATSGNAPDDVLALAASLDQASGHVLATAVISAARGRGCQLATPHEVEEVPGLGIRGLVDGHQVAVGQAAWCGIAGTAVTPAWAKVARRRARLDGALTVFVALDGSPAGVLILDDPVRPDAGRTLRGLRTSGIERIVMVTGDRSEVAESVGSIIGVDAVLAERSPAEKVDAVRTEMGRGSVLMVGDGINDAPALALADVGVAMGARGASASSQAADAVLTVDRLDRLGEVISIARRTRSIAQQSVLAGIGMSLAAMAAAGVGLLPAVWGALLQEAIDVAVILNALRALQPPSAVVRLRAADAELTMRYAGEHKMIRADIEELRAAADSLGFTAPAVALSRVQRVHDLLLSDVVPHENAEEQELYPALDRMLGSPEVTATMSRGHVEIAHQVRRLGQLLDDIGAGPPDDADLADLRALLYGLHAILRLHTTQEDESYLSLAQDASASVARLA